MIMGEGEDRKLTQNAADEEMPPPSAADASASPGTAEQHAFDVQEDGMSAEMEAFEEGEEEGLFEEEGFMEDGFEEELGEEEFAEGADGFEDEGYDTLEEALADALDA